METGSKIFLIASVGMAFVLVGAFIWDEVQPVTEDNRIIDVCIDSHEGAHNHADLEIYIRGEKVTIPGETGVEPNCMRGIHTHGHEGEPPSDTLHIEAPPDMEARLEHFFIIWDQPFTDTTLLDATVGEGESITLEVDGEVIDDPQNHLLKNGQLLILRLE